MKPVLSAVIVALIISVIILSLTPPVGRDDLVHHLAIPKLYLKHGGVYEIPSLIFSYYPMNLDMLYLIPLYFGNDIAPKFIHFSFALMTAWLIYNYLRRKINVLYAMLGVVFFLSVPIIIKLSISAYVDLGLVFFSTASLLLLLQWREQQFKLKFLILSAICCGLALGTKYNALIIFFLLTMFAVFLCARHLEMLNVIRNGIIYILVALVVFSPWMIRNWHWTQNPLYPFYNSLFNPKPVSDISKTVPPKHYGIFTFRSVVYDESIFEIATLPLRVFFQGEDGNAKYFDGRLNPMLLLLPIAAFIRSKNDDETIRKEKKILLSFSLLFFIFTMFLAVMRVRYLTPMVPPLVILSVFGAKNLIDQTENLRNRKLIILIISILLIPNLHYMIKQFEYVRPYEYISGNISRDDYIVRYRPEHKAIGYINSELSPNALILFVFTGKRGYYCDRNYLLDSQEDENKSFLGLIADRSDKAEDILSELKKMGITHILTRADLFSGWIDEQLSPKSRNIFKEFLSKYAVKRFFENGFVVLEVEHSNV